MTAVEIARARLAHAAEKRAAPKRRAAITRARHGDSGTQSALEGALESVLARSMTMVDALPDDIAALRALILAERAERMQLAERNAVLERLEHVPSQARSVRHNFPISMR